MSDTQMAVSTIGWPTKAEAGKALGVTPKTIEKYVQQGRLRQQMQAQINKPARVVIDPASIEEMLSERSQMPSGNAPSLTTAEQGENRSLMPAEAILELFSSHKPSELRHKLYLVEAEAIIYTGLGQHELRKHAKAERRGPRGALVYRRTELENI